MTKETLDSTNKLIIPTSGKDTKSQEIFESLESISDDELLKVGEELEESKRKEEERIEKLKGDSDAILNDLKENHVKIEEEVKMHGYRGKKVHIDLPAVGNFKGFKFDYFISYEYLYKIDIESKSELEKKSYSMKDISNLLQQINKYMIELQGKDDGNMDYENELKDWKTKNIRCNAGDCLKNITGLDQWYWLIDKNVSGIKDLHVYLDCLNDNCRFRYHSDEDDRAKLFLRLSD